MRLPRLRSALPLFMAVSAGVAFGTDAPPSWPPAPPLPAASANAANCAKPPFGSRDLYVRGTMNNWSAPDDQRLWWTCDHYELVTDLRGDQSFKIGDEDWSADADFGLPASSGTATETPSPARALVLKGEAWSQRFAGGPHKLVLTVTGDRRRLSVSPCPPASQACTTFQPSAQATTSVTDPVALSLRFDSRDTAFKKPFGAQPARSWMEFQLSALPGISRAELVIERRRLEGNQEQLSYEEQARVPLHRVKGPPDADGRERWRARHRFGAPAIYGYYFVVTIAGQQYLYQNNKDSVYWTREKGSMGLGLVDDMPASPQRIRRYRQTIHASDFTVPTWARDAIYYYVFPERFRNGDKTNDPQPGRDRYQDHDIEHHARWLDRPYKPGSGDGSDAVYNNDFFGGDLAGVLEKLDYIRALGANTIYLTPVLRAASNHKYDTADYRQIDPAFGRNADFERLTADARQRGLRVIPDTSFNHVGADSPYFNRFGNFPDGGAFDRGRINPASPYASWFKLDPSQTDPDRQYAGWIGIKDLPEIDKSSRAFRQFAYGGPDSVTQFWLDKGAAGWRMDVVPWVPDDFWREWRRAVKAKHPDALTIAETWFDASKYFLGDTFDSTMNYIFRNAVLDFAAGKRADRLYPSLELMREAYPPQALFATMNLLSSHDQPRALHHFGIDESPGAASAAPAAPAAPAAAASAASAASAGSAASAALASTTAGAPSTAGGSDSAVSADREAAARLDDAKRRLRLAMLFQMTYPGAPAIYYGDEVGVGGGEDPYNRAPYPWADEGGHPDEALLADVQRMTALRRDQPVLRHGSLDTPLLVDEHVIVLLRRDGPRTAIVALNNATERRQVEIDLPAALQKLTLRDAWTDSRLQAPSSPVLPASPQAPIAATPASPAASAADQPMSSAITLPPARIDARGRLSLELLPLSGRVLVNE